jgi:hypothetical protein
VLTHHLGEGERLAAGLDGLIGPLLGMLCDRRITGRAEHDPFLLDVIAGEHEAPDPEHDDDDSEHDQHASGDVSTDLQDLALLMASSLAWDR